VSSCGRSTSAASRIRAQVRSNKGGHQRRKAPGLTALRGGCYGEAYGRNRREEDHPSERLSKVPADRLRESQARVDSDPRDEKVTAIRDQKSRCRGVRLHGWKMDACGLIDRASDLLVACSSI
jgi:hypothetical protein